MKDMNSLSHTKWNCKYHDSTDQLIKIYIYSIINV